MKLTQYLKEGVSRSTAVAADFVISRKRALWASLGPQEARSTVVFFAGIVAIALAGVILQASFSVKETAASLIFGGSVALAGEGGEASSFAAVAAPSVNAFADELDVASEPAADSLDSVSASTIFEATPSVVPAGMRIHVVRPGETIYGIANRYGVDQQALARANRSLGSTLIVGEELVIPETGAVRANGSNPSAHLTIDTYLPKGFMWPIMGRFSGRHGPYNAYDIPALTGSPVKASGPGIVINAEYGWNGGYGTRVIIDHAEAGVNVKTTYNHLSEILVVPGQRVEKGDVIGLIGSTGHSTGPHLHFEVRW
jgi:LysM repeat protein